MFDKAIYLVALTVYTALAGVLLVHFDANVLFVMLFLTVLPTCVFWYQERLHTRLLPPLMLLTLVATTIIEIFAYVNGLWYEVSPFAIRVFGLFPLEAYLAGFMHILYFIVLYEYFFDDRRTKEPARSRSVAVVQATVGSLLALSLAYLYLFSGLLFTYAFALLITLGAVTFLVLLLRLRVRWRSIGKKTLLFACAVLPLSLMYEYVALTNEIRFFGNYNDYLYLISFGANAVPLEELLFIFFLPLWVAVTYELYFDDAR